MISSFKTTKTNKFRLPLCGCQKQLEMPNYGSGAPIDSNFNCGCIDPCGCQVPYLNILDLPFLASFASSIPIEAYSYLLPEIGDFVRAPIPRVPSPVADVPNCACQTPKCGCHIADCGCQRNKIGGPVPNYRYPLNKCECRIPECACQGFGYGCPNCARPLTECRCQNLNCGCQAGACNCQNSPCTCQISPCTCQSSPCTCQSSPCTCRSNPCSCQSSPCTCQSNPCTCQSNPCTCQRNQCTCESDLCICKALQMPNIFDFLTSIEMPYPQGTYSPPYDFTSYYGLSVPNCNYQPNCAFGPIQLLPNPYDSPPFDMFGYNYDLPACSCGCHLEIPISGLELPKCACQLPNCCCRDGICNCGMDCGCGCGKYLRQITLQPPFL